MTEIESLSCFSGVWNSFSGLLKPITKPIAFALNFFRAKKEERGVDENRVFNTHTKQIRILERAMQDPVVLDADLKNARKIISFLKMHNTEIEKDRKLKKEFFKLSKQLSAPAQRQFGEFYYLSSPRPGEVVVPTRLQTCRYFEEYNEDRVNFPEAQDAGG